MSCEMPKPDYVYFHKLNGERTIKGRIVVGWYGTRSEPPFEEILIELDEIIPILDYVKKQVGKDKYWTIENGKLITHKR